MEVKQNIWIVILLCSSLSLHAVDYAQDDLSVTYDNDESKNTAVGRESNADGTGSVAVGYKANAENSNSLALGTEAEATGNNAQAIGYSAEASNYAAIAVGTEASASGSKSEAIGWHAEASSGQAVAIGSGDTDARKTEASGARSVALGSGSSDNGATLATGSESIAIGSGAEATKTDSIAIGSATRSEATNAISIGTASVVSADNSVALGSNSVADEEMTVSVGAVGEERKIVNVADGINAYDAVNISQLNTVILADGDKDSTNEIQDISTDGTAGNIALSDGSTLILNVDDADADSTNELISSATLNGTNLEITDAGGTQTVDLSILDNSGTDDQQISSSIVTANESVKISLEDGGDTTIDIRDADADSSNELNTNVSLNGTNLEVTDAGGIKSTDLAGLVTVQGTTNAGNITTNTGLTLSGSNLNLVEHRENGTEASNLTVDLSELTTTQGTTNASNIAINTSDIATNAADITTNTNNITENSILIDGNTRGIAVNSARISSNTQRIEIVEDKIQYIHIDQSTTALGRDAIAASTGSVALGETAEVKSAAKGGVALGSQALVTDTAQSSVALGQYSVANEANTISVGNDSLKRRVVNVADGINDYDAVNMRQLNGLERKMSGIGAMNSAMSALVPNQRVSSDTQLSIGLGYYDSEAAIAGGMFHYINDDILLNAGLSYSRESGTAARAGITWGF